MLARRSIRRALLIYALVTCAALALAIATVAGLLMVETLRRDRIERAALTYADSAPTNIEGRASAGAPLTAHPTGKLVGTSMRTLLVTALGAAVLAALALTWLTSRLILSPLRGMTARIGASDLEPWSADDDGGHDEIVALARALRLAQRRNDEAQTQRARRETDIARLQAQLARADKLASIGQLAAGLAHEVGNPLAATMGYLRLLERGMSVEQTAEIVGRSLTQLERIHQTITKLLGFSRADAGVELHPVRLDAVLADVLALARMHPVVQGSDVVALPSCSEPIEALAHAEHVTHIVLNLVINAAHALAGAGRISLDIQRTGASVVIVVEDSGPGVPDHLRERIFDPFYTTRPVGEGTGLGLAVSRALAHEMRGSLRVGTPPNLVGARFELELRSTLSVTRPT